MENTPLVSIICTSFNHEPFIIEALDSVKNQDYKNIELIVVDDFSSDKSSKTIKKWIKNNNWGTFIQNKRNIGITKSFNKAFQNSKGDYFIDLAADDKLKYNCISQLLDTFKNSTYLNLGLVYGNAKIIDKKGSFVRNHFPVDGFGKTIKRIPTGDVYETIISDVQSLCSVAAMVRREVFIALNGYDSTLYYEDLDFWIRASRKYNFDFKDEVVVEKRIVKGSLGDYFKKKDKHYKQINNSTFIILNNTLLLNKNNREHRKLLKRIVVMIKRALRNIDFKYSYKYSLLFIKTHFYILKKNSN
jgi:glycosyltransferase involved in cell wall biosynthesis